MTGPDSLVERGGEQVTLERIVDFEIDANGQVTNKEAELIDINAIVSNPTEKDEQRLEGRLSTGALRLTVVSDVDVSGDRDGRRDRIYRPALEDWGTGGWGEHGWGGFEATTRLYQVTEVRDDTNPLTGTRKKTVIIDELSSHE